MDRIYKGYPFGSLLFWRTREKLLCDRKLGPFELPAPQADYPIDYVLDGQQRITSIFGVFQTQLDFSDHENWLPIYYDISAPELAQESQFFALSEDEVDLDRHFPLATLYDTVGYRKATARFGEDIQNKIDAMQAKFKETLIPVQGTDTEDKATVAIIFERVNRQGVELDTLQLLSAWTWSEDFQLQDKFKELAEELSPFGFEDVGGDTNLLLRCCSGVLSHDASPQALMALNGAAVRERFDVVTNGVKYAVDYLRRNLHAESLSNLPFTTMLVPLSAFFAVPGNKERGYTDAERRQINRWLWRTAFSRRYSSGVLRNLKTDIEEIVKLRDGQASSLGDFDASVDPDYFIKNTFGIGNVNTKTFILMLASKKPRSFISGAEINLEVTLKQANRAEFHHLMPRGFLRETDQTAKYHESALANFAFLSRADNRELGGVAPSEYQKKMASNSAEILESAVCIPELLFADTYEPFLETRAGFLATVAGTLCENFGDRSPA